MKATWCQVNGEEREIFKCPKTDSGMKKSLKGLIRVYKDNGKLYAQDCVSREDEKDSLLQTVFKDGVLCKEYTLSKVRQNVNDSIQL
jgi:nicotinamide phosphoribosyltransferase